MKYGRMVRKGQPAQSEMIGMMQHTYRKRKWEEEAGSAIF